MRSSRFPARTGRTRQSYAYSPRRTSKNSRRSAFLAGNGYGSGATKLLRSFYERVVTLSYLSLNPKKVQQFIDYTSIHWHKLLTEAEKIHSTVNMAAESIQKIKDDYESHKDRFMEDLCKPCNKRRPQMSWTKKPVPDQASEVNERLRALCFNAYLRPTFYLHTTFLGITWQAQKTDAGKLAFLPTDVERGDARESLELAHILLVHVADVVNDTFKLGQDERVKEIASEWKDSWEQVAGPVG